MNRVYAGREPFGLAVVMLAMLSAGAGCGASDNASNGGPSNGMVNPNTLPNGNFGNQMPVGSAGNSGGATMNVPQQNTGTGGSGTGDPDTNMPITGVPHSI